VDLIQAIFAVDGRRDIRLRECSNAVYQEQILQRVEKLDA